MILLDYVFRISLVLAILFFGIAVAYFFGMNVRKLIFDVKEMEDNMPKETSKGKQVATKLETENIKMARKQRNDSGRMKLSKNKGKEENVPRTKDGFVDMEKLKPQEKPVYIHDRKGKLQSNQVPFVDEDDIYDPSNDATSYMGKAQEPVKEEDNKTSYLEPEGTKTSYLESEPEPEDVGTSYLGDNDAVNDDPLNNQFTGVTEDDLREEELTDETSFLGEEQQVEETSPEPEEFGNEEDHTSYLEPPEPEEEVEDGTTYLDQGMQEELPAPIIAEEEEDEDNATTMLTSQDYPGYAYVDDTAPEVYHDDAELELEDIGEQENKTTYLDDQQELGIVRPSKRQKQKKKSRKLEDEDDDDATSYLDYYFDSDN